MRRNRKLQMPVTLSPALMAQGSHFDVKFIKLSLLLKSDIDLHSLVAYKVVRNEGKLQNY